MGGRSFGTKDEYTPAAYERKKKADMARARARRRLALEYPDRFAELVAEETAKIADWVTEAARDAEATQATIGPF